MNISITNIGEKDEEGKPKRNDQDWENQQDLHQCLQNLQEHHHIDSHLIESLQKQK